MFVKRLSLVGAALALALLAVACDGADVANPPPLTAGPGSNTLFTPDEVGEGETVDLPQEVCAKLMSCLPPGSTQANRFMEGCLAEMEEVAFYVLDPATFVSCFRDLSCATLRQNDAALAALLQCAAIDLQSIRCVSDMTVEFCTTSGTCKQVDCRKICTDAGASSGACGEMGCRCFTDVPQYGSGD